MSDIASKVLIGDSRSIARLITLAENNDQVATDAMKSIHPKTGGAHVIGITGVMGSGKSTLIYELTREYRKKGLKVGIIAIDPTSPFSGGALLGDRIRMTELATDDDFSNNQALLEIYSNHVSLISLNNQNPTQLQMRAF